MIGACWASGSWASTPDAWATGSWSDGASVPANLDPETAIVIGALPYTFSQNVHSADTGLTYSVYYQYTPTEDAVISVFAFGDLTTYMPRMAVLVNNGLDLYLNISNYQQRPFFFPVTAGVTYWIYVGANVGNPSPAVLSLSVRAFTEAAAPAGSIFINDATSGWPAAVLSSATGLPLAYQRDVAAGEIMAQVGAYLLVQDVAALNYKLYNGQYDLIGSIALYDGIRLGSDRSTRFYLGEDATGATPGLVRTADVTGTIGATTWTVASGTSSLSPSRDNTILYYADGSSGAVIQRWDLVNDTALSNLAAGVVGYTVRNLFVLGDGSVLVLYLQAAGTGTQAIRYSAAGATLNTYTTQFTDNVSTDPHIAIAADDPTSWWAWFKIAGGKSRFTNVRSSDGVVLAALEDYHFSSGLYDGATSATPGAYFGHSESCTFIITGLAPTPPPAPGTGRSLIIRRLRRAPHLSREQLWNFYHLLQLDLETGVGLSDGQGEDPQIMLRWSDDGGHTWSNEYWVSAGRQGQYKARAMFRRLGRSRDRIFEVVVSDPVRWALIAAYLDVTAGES